MTGKDYLAGSLIPWWLYTRSNSLCVATGPSQTSLSTITWKECRRACDDSKIPLGMFLSSGAKTSPLVCAVDARKGWQALGYSTNNVERASGQHNANLFVLVGEASGVENTAWDGINSLGFVRLLAYGNPIRAEGRYIDLIRQAEKDRQDGIPPHRAVNAIRISSRESPDAGIEKSLRGLADKTWIEDCERRYGKDSLWVRSHIDALIPTVSSDRLIPDSWLDYACACERPPLRPFDPITKTRRISCDLGEGVGRDSTAILVRDSLGVLEWTAGSALGLAEAAAEIARLKRKWGVPDERISWDKLGIGRDLRNKLAGNGVSKAIPYAGSGGAKDKRSFTNIRTEAAWALRTRLNPDWSTDPRFPLASRQPPFHIPPDEHWALLREELQALTYDLIGNQTRLISKEDWADILGRSPDRADALIQSFFQG